MGEARSSPTLLVDGMHPELRSLRLPCCRNATAPLGSYVRPLPGTGQLTTLHFVGGGETHSIQVSAGSSLLRAAEECNAIKVYPDFCLEGEPGAPLLPAAGFFLVNPDPDTHLHPGSCEACLCEVVGGALEVGPKSMGNPEVCRSCLAVVPQSQTPVEVLLLGKEDVWSTGMV